MNKNCLKRSADQRNERERRNITVDGGEELAASTGEEWRRLEEGGGPRCCSSEEGREGQQDWENRRECG